MLKVFIKPNSISVLTHRFIQFHFDYSGRLIGHFNHGDHFRIGLDGTVLYRSQKKNKEDQFLNLHQTNRLFQAWIDDWKIWPEETVEVLNQNEWAFDLNLFFNSIILKAQFRERDAISFRQIWGKIPILPPEFYSSVVINFSKGCSHNDCKFCSFYKDKPFSILNSSQLHHHINSIKEFFGNGITARRDLFIGEANALAIPQNRLIELMTILRDEKIKLTENYPELKINRTGSFLDGFTGIHKSSDDWKELKELGLTDVALGIESGHSEILSLAGKPYQASDVVETIGRIKNAGLNLQLIFLLGLGGRNYKTVHFEKSVKLMEKLNLTKNDRIQLSFLNQELTPPDYPFQADFLTEDELETEYQKWKSVIVFHHPKLEVRKYPTRLFVV